LSPLEAATVRLSDAIGGPLDPATVKALNAAPDALAAWEGLARVAVASGNPATLGLGLSAAGPMVQGLAAVLGASRPLTDTLVHHPELAMLLLDPEELDRPADRTTIHREGERLLSNARSHQHRLDRLRYLKQAWTLRLAALDLTGGRSPIEIWTGITTLAEALIELALQVVWQQTLDERGLEGECPLAVVGFGKLGAGELNYSSDIDLVYVIPDDTDEAAERRAMRTAERLGRALSDRMGRGSLYRVDLRLRPYGGTGPVVSRMSAIEAYYDRYAETWEHLALIRSRVVIGPPALTKRWEAMRHRVAFTPYRGEWVLDELLDLRQRTEEIGRGDDLKRGQGGIRDIEFLTQILQMLYGSRDPALTVRPTPNALFALQESSLITSADAETLLAGYVLLRQTEHRVQLTGDQQTHSLPEDAAARLRLARSLGFADEAMLVANLKETRRAVREVYDRTLRSGAIQPRDDAREAMSEAFGRERSLGQSWFDGMPDAPAYYESLRENATSLSRVRIILHQAPHLVPELRDRPALTEAVLSGEIEEPGRAIARLSALNEASPPEVVGPAVAALWYAALARWVLDPSLPLGPALAEVAMATLRALVGEAPYEMVALGSFASEDLAPNSDLDLLLVARADADPDVAEEAGQRLMGQWQDFRRWGLPFPLDLRLRPEGRKGRLVRTQAAFRQYEASDMETWERFALGRSLAISADPASLMMVRDAAYVQRLGEQGLDALIRMKRRIETERVAAQDRWRDVKLGWGGSDDVDWLVQLCVMRFGVREAEAIQPKIAGRLRSLVRNGILNAAEADLLREARTHLGRVRAHLVLLGIDDHRVPENPDRLQSLAEAMGDNSANDFLANHTRVTRSVRALWEETVVRLRD